MPGFPVQGDLSLSDDGRTLLFPTSEADRVRQSIRIRAQIFLGSWLYDTKKGVPYLQEILVANANPALVRRRFYELLKETPGVVSVPNLTVVFDRSAEMIRVSFVVTVVGGTVSDVLDLAA